MPFFQEIQLLSNITTSFFNSSTPQLQHKHKSQINNVQRTTKQHQTYSIKPTTPKNTQKTRSIMCNQCSRTYYTCTECKKVFPDIRLGPYADCEANIFSVGKKEYSFLCDACKAKARTPSGRVNRGPYNARVHPYDSDRRRR